MRTNAVSRDREQHLRGNIGMESRSCIRDHSAHRNQYLSRSEVRPWIELRSFLLAIYSLYCSFIQVETEIVEGGEVKWCDEEDECAKRRLSLYEGVGLHDLIDLYSSG